MNSSHLSTESEVKKGADKKTITRKRSKKKRRKNQKNGQAKNRFT
jgi:hypothetical protein